MTRTCAPCNNGLGSRVEGDLADWHDNALTIPTFSGEAVPGARRSSRVLYRATPTGEPVLIVDRGFDPAVRDLLLSGRVDLGAYLPDPNRVRIGLLKHAFLAACLQFGLIGSEADVVRHDLIAARDAPSRGDVPRSDIALGLTVLRSDGGPQLDWPVVHCLAETEENESIHGVMLAGTTFVSWHSDLPAEREVQQSVNASLTVGRPIDGVVRTVDGR
jgi:hypothetical protein